MIKEAFDDIKRYKRDNEANQKCYKVIDLKKRKVKLVHSRKLKVGDIIEINSLERIPADLLLLHTTEKGGQVFLRTDQLDGETDWKLRQAINFTQDYYNTQNTFYDIDGTVIYNKPDCDIYNFNGVFEGRRHENITKEPLTLQNTLWANTMITSGKSIGVILYTGKHTKMALNTRKPRNKTGIFDAEINYISKLLFGIMAILAALIFFTSGIEIFNINSYVLYFRYVLLLASIIPISMRVNLDFAKTYFSYLISHDKMIEGCIARNSGFPEELGRIDYILTDKTGTLTKNEMVLKKLSMQRDQFSSENKSSLDKCFLKHCKKFKGPMSDYIQRIKEQEQLGKVLKNFKRKKEFIIRDFLMALVLCHNVTPSESEGTITYQASSPDEIAFVKFCETINLKLIKRDQKSI